MTFYIMLAVLALAKLGNGQEGICKLEWITSSRGMHDKVEFAVGSDGSSQLVSRSSLSGTLETTILGRVNMATGIGYFSNTDESFMSTNYDILINRYNCNLEWVSPNNPSVTSKSVCSTPSCTSFVGRAQLENGTLASGSVRDKILIVLDDSSNIIRFEGSSYDVLISHSFGMELDISNVLFDTDPYSGPIEMLGQDFIINEADATVTQTIEHSKMVSESYYFSMTRIENTKISFIFCIFFCFSKSYQHSETVDTESEFSSYEERAIRVSRSITVPAHSSVESCSTFSKNNFESAWTAKAVFSSKGQSGQEVYDVLKTDPNWTDYLYIVTDTSAETNITGSFKGGLVTSSKMYLTDKDNEGCSALRSYIEKKSKNLSSWGLEDAKKQELFVNQLMVDQFTNKNKIV